MNYQDVANENTWESFWDNPFSIPHPTPDIILPNNQVAVDIEFIRNQQALLRPILEDVYKEATSVMRVKNRSAVIDASIDCNAQIIYRLPDYPQFIEVLPIQFGDSTVAIQVSEKDEAAKILRRILPEVKITRVVDPTDIASNPIKPEKDLTLHEALTVFVPNEEEPEKSHFLVRPKAMKLALFWIKEIEGPMHGFAIEAAPHERTLTATNRNADVTYRTTLPSPLSRYNVFHLTHAKPN